MKKKGFTLIELVLVIAVLGVLAVSALPNIFDISLSNARTNARDAVASAVQAGLSLYAANQISQGNAESYPTNLETTDLADGTAASRTTPMFNQVIQGGVTKDWTKDTDVCYTYTSGGATDTYKYTAGTTGTFVGVATCP